MNLFEFGDYTELPLSTDKIDDFKSFISEVWKNRNQFSEYDDLNQTEIDDLESEFKEQKQFFLRFAGNKISARNYIGFIHYEDLEINIYPKIFRNSLSPHYSSYLKSIFLWLSYCSKVKFPFTEINLELQDFDSFIEAFIFLFASYTEKTIYEKPYQCYEETSEETAFLKGKIAMPEYIKNNLSTGNWQSFYSYYEPFVYDNRFNQIIKYTATLLLKVSKNKKSIAKLSSIKFILDEVTNTYCSYYDCDKVKFNRLFDEYNFILSMCKMFLSSQIISNTGKSNLNFCFLLPMEYVFEDFIFGFINRHLPEYQAEYQKSNLYLAKDSNSGKDVFQIQNDIFLNNPKMIIDTKYKIREYSSDDKKAGIYQNDMYQMLSYAVRHKCNNVIMFYPQKSNTNNHQEKSFIIESKMFNNENIKIKAYDLDIIIKNNQEISYLKSQIEKAINEM